MATVSTLIETLKEFVDESTTGSYPTNNEIIQWFCDGEQIIAEETECLKEYTSSSVDVSESTVISLPSDWIRGKQVMWGRTNHLEYVEIDDLLESAYDITTTGTPNYWYVWDDQIQFYPVPSADGTAYLYYIKAPTAMTTTGDSPSIPAHYQKLLVHYAGYRFWLKEEEPQMAQIFYSEFLAGMAKMKSTYTKRGKRQHYRTKDVRGYL